jgi:hypothetical protein
MGFETRKLQANGRDTFGSPMSCRREVSRSPRSSWVPQRELCVVCSFRLRAPASAFREKVRPGQLPRTANGGGVKTKQSDQARKERL